MYPHPFNYPSCIKCLDGQDKLKLVQELPKQGTEVRKQIRTPVRTAVTICLYRITEQVRSCNLTRKPQRGIKH